jgi:SHS2 domain-containing protein
MTAIEWLDHGADVGLRTTGSSIEEVFCEAARGLFSCMIELEYVRPQTEHRVEVAAATRRALLVEWLADLLAQKELSGLVFSRFDVVVSGDETTGMLAHGRALGERLDPRRHGIGTEVKGISHLGLEVRRQDDGQWLAQVVVDV